MSHPDPTADLQHLFYCLETGFLKQEGWQLLGSPHHKKFSQNLKAPNTHYLTAMQPKRMQTPALSHAEVAQFLTARRAYPSHNHTACDGVWPHHSSRQTHTHTCSGSFLPAEPFRLEFVLFCISTLIFEARSRGLLCNIFAFICFDKRGRFGMHFFKCLLCNAHNQRINVLWTKPHKSEAVQPAAFLKTLCSYLRQNQALK